MAHFGYLNRRETSERFMVAPEWITQQTKSGALPHIRFGREVLVKPEDFEAYIETLKSPAPESSEVA